MHETVKLWTHTDQGELEEQSFLSLSTALRPKQGCLHPGKRREGNGAQGRQRSASVRVKKSPEGERGRPCSMPVAMTDKMVLKAFIWGSGGPSPLELMLALLGVLTLSFSDPPSPHLHFLSLKVNF